MVIHRPPGTPGCYLHRDIYKNYSEDVFDNVKNLFRRAESLVTDSTTSKRRELSRMWRSAARKVTEARTTPGSMKRIRRWLGSHGESQT